MHSPFFRMRAILVFLPVTNIFSVYLLSPNLPSTECIPIYSCSFVFYLKKVYPIIYVDWTVMTHYFLGLLSTCLSYTDCLMSVWGIWWCSWRAVRTSRCRIAVRWLFLITLLVDCNWQHRSVRWVWRCFSIWVTVSLQRDHVACTVPCYSKLVRWPGHTWLKEEMTISPSCCLLCRLCRWGDPLWWYFRRDLWGMLYGVQPFPGNCCFKVFKCRAWFSLGTSTQLRVC